MTHLRYSLATFLHTFTNVSQSTAELFPSVQKCKMAVAAILDYIFVQDYAA